MHLKQFFSNSFFFANIFVAAIDCKYICISKEPFLKSEIFEFNIFVGIVFILCVFIINFYLISILV